MVGSLQGCSVIDLFCGVGGLTHGFIEEGFKVLAGIDIDPACRYPYEANNTGAKFIHKDVTKVSATDISKLYPRNDIKVLVGCAPCQPFSQYNKKQGGNDDKWKLLAKFGDLIEGARPDVVSMENVPDLARFKSGSVLKNFISRLESAGYSVTYSNVFCPEYGVPQNRTRLVLFASFYGPVKMVYGPYDSKNFISVRQAISRLPAIGAGEVHEADPLHRAAGLSTTNLKRIRQSVPGGTWRDWDEDLVAACHTKESGASYDCVYGRMRWDDPAPTITTQCNGYGNGRFGHPEQNRAISMREAAILQSFPESYQFAAPDKHWHIETIARLIGNAVPVKLAQAIARSIKIHLG